MRVQQIWPLRLGHRLMDASFRSWSFTSAWGQVAVAAHGGAPAINEHIQDTGTSKPAASSGQPGHVQQVLAGGRGGGGWQHTGPNTSWRQRQCMYSGHLLQPNPYMLAVKSYSKPCRQQPASQSRQPIGSGYRRTRGEAGHLHVAATPPTLADEACAREPTGECARALCTQPHWASANETCGRQAWRHNYVVSCSTLRQATRQARVAEARTNLHVHICSPCASRSLTPASYTETTLWPSKSRQRAAHHGSQQPCIPI